VVDKFLDRRFHAPLTLFVLEGATDPDPGDRIKRVAGEAVPSSAFGCPSNAEIAALPLEH
jgi:hypothetical protein